MEEYLLEDGTVNFLPNRLNRQPVVVKGLTANELWLTVAITGVIGLVCGITIAIFTGQIGMAPTTVLVTIGLGIFAGGGLLRRKKRGRPETWLYRQIQFSVALNYPTLAALFGGKSLITHSTWWEVKRSQVSRPATKKRKPANPGKNRRKGKNT